MNSDTAAADSPAAMGAAQRIYVYVVLLATGLVASAGLTVLGSVAAGAAWPANGVEADLSERLALGLSLIIVAGSVWFLHWRVAAREVARVPDAHRWPLRQVYLNLMLLAALLIAIFSAWIVLADLLTGDIAGTNRFPVAAAPIWAAVWFFHWRAAGVTWQPGHIGRSLHRWYLHFSAALGLSLVAVGASVAVTGVVQSGYESAFSNEFPIGSAVWERGTAEGAAIALIAGVVWAWHWWAGVRRDRGSTLRTVYTTLASTIPLALLIAALVRMLAGVIRLALGAGTESVALSLNAAPAAASAAVVFAPVWLHHVRQLPLLATPAATGPGAPVWAYRYALRGAALAALSTFVVVAIGLLIALGVPVARADGDWWRHLTSSALAALAAGAVAWRYVGRQEARAEGMTERDVPRLRVRRLYLFTVTALGVLAAVGAGATLLSIVLNDLLNGELGTATLAGSRWAIAVMLTAAGVALLHRRYAGPDIGAAVADLRPRRVSRIVLVAPQGAGEMKSLLEQALDRAVEWREDRSAPAGPVPLPDRASIAGAARAAGNAPGREVLVILGPDGVQVVSYD